MVVIWGKGAVSPWEIFVRNISFWCETFLTPPCATRARKHVWRRAFQTGHFRHQSLTKDSDANQIWRQITSTCLIDRSGRSPLRDVTGTLLRVARCPFFSHINQQAPVKTTDVTNSAPFQKVCLWRHWLRPSKLAVGWRRRRQLGDCQSTCWVSVNQHAPVGWRGTFLTCKQRAESLWT